MVSDVWLSAAQLLGSLALVLGRDRDVQNRQAGMTSGNGMVAGRMRRLALLNAFHWRG